MHTNLLEELPRRGVRAFRRHSSAWTVLLVAFGAGSALAEPDLAKEPPVAATSDTVATGESWLRVTTEPSGAFVFVDGELMGPSPLMVGVSAGEHRVWFRSLPPPEFEPQPIPIRKITVPPGDTLQVAETVGSVSYLTSEPPGASIVQGSEIIGVTPAAIRWGRDTGEIQLLADFHLPARVSLARFVPGNTVHVALEKDPVSAVAPAPDRSSPGWLPWGILAASGVSAGLAVALKSVADDEFDRYERAALPGEMARRIDRANRYDRYSSVAWVAAEAGVVVGFWLLRDRLFGGADDEATLELAPDHVGVTVPWP